MTRLQTGLIHRDKPLAFRFNGKHYKGFEGDTLASALLANGVQLIGRSFKYHRPRGIVSSGSDDPNGLVTLGNGALAEPNTRASVTELFAGLEATSQNHIGSLDCDLMAVNDLLSPFFAAGFYYKTFMWPRKFWESLYEPLIRRAAGLGRLSGLPDPDSYDKGFLHCDVLVVGGGAAGLTAALCAGRAGASVILVDEDFRLGGRLLAESDLVNGAPAAEWIAAVQDELQSLPNVRIMTRSTVFGTYDHGIFGCVERVADHVAETMGQVRQTLWRITAKQAVLAAGATERHIPFADNDRPGIMMAGAVRAYVNRWGVTPTRQAGQPIAIFTNNDDGHRSALDLLSADAPVAAVVDVRPDAQAFGDYQLIRGASVTGSKGRLGLKAIQVTRGSKSEWITAGALGVSGGWNPNVHLASHHRGRPVWDESILAFVPGSDSPKWIIPAGAAAGRGGLRDSLADGLRAAHQALQELGRPVPKVDVPDAENSPNEQAPYWYVPGKKRAWVDFQNDVTVKDIALAKQENMIPIEHLKRWTTLGMATDQGKTSNIPALAIMAELTGRSIAETGTTIFRPPYTGVSLSALGGGDMGKDFRPVRLTPTHHWAEKQGAVFVEAGAWLRAQYFPQTGESHWRESVDREVLAVRRDVGLCDVTTLGKIDVQGRDAATFLDRIYANGMASLKPGKVRYGLMLREDGHAYDDGTCACLAENHYVVTTTTANAGLVYRQMEFARQCLWPDLEVSIVSTTDAWAQIAVAGPKSRDLLMRIVDQSFDISNAALPFMGCMALTVCGGLRARLFRISFSGELAYEIAVPAAYGHALMARFMDVGADLGVTPYGTEALSVLRVEKGHAAGAELNGQTTAAMLGLDRMVSTKKDSIGAVMSRREGLAQDTRRLVGLRPKDPNKQIMSGSHLFNLGATHSLDSDQGWVTSSCYSPHLGSYIALGFLNDGDTRAGEVIVAANPLQDQTLEVEVVSPHFIDPEGGRLRD